MTENPQTPSSTEATKATRHATKPSDAQVSPEPDRLIDTLGELPAVYGAATVAFVGGSLEPFGGHSPLEPAAAGAPVLFGPHTDNVAHPARELVSAGGARQVRDATELSAAASAWLANAQLRNTAAEAAAAVIRKHEGAMRQTFDALVEIAESGPA